MTPPAGYSRTRIALHWIAAALIVQQYVFKDAIAAAWKAARDGVEAGFDPLVPAHVVGGGLVMLLALWRLATAARVGMPAAMGDNAVQRLLARLTHAGLYAVMILMPVSGALAWFGGVQTAAAGHNVLKVALLALVALHVIGALYHHFVLRDGLINRMRCAQS